MANVTNNVQVVREYYERGDAGRADILDLFSDDIEFYFPKFGVGRGKQAFGEFATGLLGSLKRLSHDFDTLRITECQHLVIVEGTTLGETAEGQVWSGGSTPGGRFASVFELSDGIITRMYVYLDPDYGSADKARFLWGEDRRW